MNDMLLPLLNGIKPWPCRVRKCQCDDDRNVGEIVFLWSAVLTVQMYDDGMWAYGDDDVDSCDEWYVYCDPLLIDKLRVLAWRSFGLSCLTCMKEAIAVAYFAAMVPLFVAVCVSSAVAESWRWLRKRSGM